MTSNFPPSSFSFLSPSPCLIKHVSALHHASWPCSTVLMQQCYTKFLKTQHLSPPPPLFPPLPSSVALVKTCPYLYMLYISTKCFILAAKMACQWNLFPPPPPSPFCCFQGFIQPQVGGIVNFTSHSTPPPFFPLPQSSGLVWIKAEEKGKWLWWMSTCLPNLNKSPPFLPSPSLPPFLPPPLLLLPKDIDHSFLESRNEGKKSWHAKNVLLVSPWDWSPLPSFPLLPPSYPQKYHLCCQGISHKVKSKLVGLPPFPPFPFFFPPPLHPPGCQRIQGPAWVRT